MFHRRQALYAICNALAAATAFAAASGASRKPTRRPAARTLLHANAHSVLCKDAASVPAGKYSCDTACSYVLASLLLQAFPGLSNRSCCWQLLDNSHCEAAAQVCTSGWHCFTIGAKKTNNSGSIKMNQGSCCKGQVAALVLLCLVCCISSLGRVNLFARCVHTVAVCA